MNLDFRWSVPVIWDVVVPLAGEICLVLSPLLLYRRSFNPRCAPTLLRP